MEPNSNANFIMVCPVCWLEFSTDATTCPQDKIELRAVPKDPFLGTTLADRYEISAILGVGGMSIVYKARHILMERLVAIKMLHSQFHNPISIKRFQQEAQAASQLNHPNLITVFDFGLLPSGQPYLVMDFAPGISLAEELAKVERLSLERSIPLFQQLCAGLAHAHQKGVIHRDLKPGNIMLTTTGEQKDFVKIVDFGLAKMMPDYGTSAHNLTQAGSVFGSPPYMSPEQCHGQTLDLRSDIYSLGCVMYHTLVGEPPLQGETSIDTIRMQAFDTPISPTIRRPDFNIPPQLSSAILRALEKDPKRRYQSVEELKRDIELTTSTPKALPSVELAIPKELIQASNGLEILVVEDQPSLRQQMAQLIREKIPGQPIIHEATNGAEGLKQFRNIKPAMIIMDISMPEMSGIQAAKQIWAESPQTKILFWSQYHREAYVREIGRIVPDDAIHGYALKSESEEKIAYAIVSVLLYDNPYIDPIVRAVQKRLQNKEQPLTDEEYETLEDLVLGLTDRAIATRRHISIRGVQSRVGALGTKLYTSQEAHTKDINGIQIPVYESRNRTIFEALKRGLLNKEDIHSMIDELDEWLAEEFDWEPH